MKKPKLFKCLKLRRLGSRFRKGFTLLETIIVIGVISGCSILFHNMWKSEDIKQENFKVQVDMQIYEDALSVCILNILNQQRTPTLDLVVAELNSVLTKDYHFMNTEELKNLQHLSVSGKEGTDFTFSRKNGLGSDLNTGSGGYYYVLELQDNTIFITATKDVGEYFLDNIYEYQCSGKIDFPIFVAENR